jgi:hypothetical protein
MDNNFKPGDRVRVMHLGYPKVGEVVRVHHPYDIVIVRVRVLVQVDDTVRNIELERKARELDKVL